MTRRASWVGIDAGADVVAICILDAAGNVLCEMGANASATAIEEALPKRREGLLVGIEAGGTAIHLTRGLRKVGYDVRVLETRHVHAFLELRQNKSDRNDARGIADILRLGWQAVPEVFVKSEHSQRLRSELVLRQRLMQQRIATESAMRGILRANGAKISRAWSGTHLEKAVLAEIERLRATGVDLGEVLLPTLEVVVMVRRTLEAITRRLTRVARDDEVCSRLMTVTVGAASTRPAIWAEAIRAVRRISCWQAWSPWVALRTVWQKRGKSADWR